MPGASSPQLALPDDLVWSAPPSQHDPILTDRPARTLSCRCWLLARRFAVVAFVAALLAVGYASDPGRARHLVAAMPEIEQALSVMGFGLEQVTVKGQRFAHASDILDALELKQTRSFISFDSRSARGKLEEMPWIEKAEFRRVYPGELVVQVWEREPFAVWKSESSVTLIDKAGKVLTAVQEASAPRELPRFGGKGAAQEAFSFWSDLGQHPKLQSNFESATFVGGRRWDVRLTNGVVLQMPDSGMADAFRQIVQWPGFQSLVLTGDAVVDLRAKGRIAVRPANSIGATSRGPRTIADLLKPAG